METRTEEWRAVAGYEGLYEVSNLGRVRSLERYVRHNNRPYHIKGGILKNMEGKNYYYVHLHHHNGTSKKLKVHRLVACAFIPNPNNLPQVNHKNECKLDNRVANLEWVTAKQNCNYGTRNERMREALKIQPRCKQVEQLTLDYKHVNTYPSIKGAARLTGIDHTTISSCCHGKLNTSGGYRWKFKEK